MTHRNPSRRLLAGTVALVIATIAGPLTLPAVADAGSGTEAVRTASGATGAAVLPPGSEVVTAGTTGFLSSTREYDLLWTRYADGSTTSLGHDVWKSRDLRHGSVSDVMATERGVLGQDADHGVELRDMSTGAVSFVTLGKNRAFIGSVGATVLACAWSSQGIDCGALRLLALVDGAQTERAVTGLPDGAASVSVVSTAPGSLVLRYRGGGGTDTDFHHAVVDLSSGVATPSRLTSPAGHAEAAAHSPAYLATLSDHSAASQLRVENRTTGAVTQIDTHREVFTPLVGLVGDWVLHGPSTSLAVGSADADHSLRAVPVGGGAGRKILDHATSLTPTPDGGVLVMGGTLAQGEGVYRVFPGADGVPLTELVAGTGQPLGITLVNSSVPAVATLDPAPWKARWQLSRPNAEVTLTLRHTATGTYNRSYLYPSSLAGPVRMDGNGLISMDWTGWTDSGSAAPNGSYTWQLVAKPLNGLGPDLTVSGTFKVTRRPAPHDHTDNGSPDLLARDSAGVLWREDTFHVPWSPKLHGTNRVKVGGGWNTYNRIAAVGNIAGGPAGDLVARDKSGALWLFQGTGKGGFTARARIGTGWNAYTQLTGMSDLSGDGKADLVARDKSGVLWLYKGTGNGKAPYAARKRISGGWNTYTQIAAVGNIAGGPAGDLVARDKSGALWLFQGTGKGGFTARARIGTGWNAYTQLIGIGDSNVDGKQDLLAIDQKGYAWRYRGTGNAKAPFAAREAADLFFGRHYNTIV
ncbi:VCBS repeat-containing protein [Streptomyces sp. NBC_00510]